MPTCGGVARALSSGPGRLQCGAAAAAAAAAAGVGGGGRGDGCDVAVWRGMGSGGGCVGRFRSGARQVVDDFRLVLGGVHARDELRDEVGQPDHREQAEHFRPARRERLLEHLVQRSVDRVAALLRLELLEADLHDRVAHLDVELAHAAAGLVGLRLEQHAHHVGHGDAHDHLQHLVEAHLLLLARRNLLGVRPEVCPRAGRRHPALEVLVVKLRLHEGRAAEAGARRQWEPAEHQVGDDLLAIAHPCHIGQALELPLVEGLAPGEGAPGGEALFGHRRLARPRHAVRAHECVDGRAELLLQFGNQFDHERRRRRGDEALLMLQPSGPGGLAPDPPARCRGRRGRAAREGLERPARCRGRAAREGLERHGRTSRVKTVAPNAGNAVNGEWPSRPFTLGFTLFIRASPAKTSCGDREPRQILRNQIPNSALPCRAARVRRFCGGQTEMGRLKHVQRALKSASSAASTYAPITGPRIEGANGWLGILAHTPEEPPSGWHQGAGATLSAVPGRGDLDGAPCTLLAPAMGAGWHVRAHAADAADEDLVVPTESLAPLPGWPIRGVSVGCLRDFAAAHVQQLAGASTESACDRVVRPLTAKAQTSLAACIERAGAAEHGSGRAWVGPPTVFISHARHCLFADLLAAIEVRPPTRAVRRAHRRRSSPSLATPLAPLVAGIRVGAARRRSRPAAAQLPPPERKDPAQRCVSSHAAPTAYYSRCPHTTLRRRSLRVARHLLAVAAPRPGAADGAAHHPRHRPHVLGAPRPNCPTDDTHPGPLPPPSPPHAHPRRAHPAAPRRPLARAKAHNCVCSRAGPLRERSAGPVSQFVERQRPLGGRLRIPNATGCTGATGDWPARGRGRGRVAGRTAAGIAAPGDGHAAFERWPRRVVEGARVAHPAAT